MSVWVALPEELYDRLQTYINEGGNIQLQNGSIQTPQPGGSPAMDQAVNIKKE